ncbi:MAG: hypothetical protein LBG65_01475 [Puniceicoccales bacterium]|nr:hypothetical protein [Puniceicoccales bacterium]
MSFKVNPFIYVAALPATAILGLAGVLLFRNVSSSDIPLFNPQNYAQSWRTLEGNTYLARGTIHQQLGYEQGKARLLSIKTFDETGIPRSTPTLIIIPAELDKTAVFEVGQRYEFTLFVNRGNCIAKKIKSY